MTPILVTFSGSYYMMVGISGSNGVLMDSAGVITLEALTSIIVSDTGLKKKVDYMNNLP
jgi:hypothetical protein